LLNGEPRFAKESLWEGNADKHRALRMERSKEDSNPSSKSWPEAELFFGSLIIPKNTELPKICIISGQENVPLIEMKWTGTKSFIHSGSFSFYISTAEKQRLDRRRVAANKMFLSVIGVFIFWLVIMYLSNTTNGLGGLLSLCFFPPLMVGIPITYVYWRSTRGYINAKLTFFGGSISIRGIHPRILQVMGLKAV
jgi:hypothetical protein